MRPAQSLDEARKYLFYVSDALNGVASSYAIGRREREILQKYASDMIDYSKNLDQLKNHLVAKEQEARKLQIVAELEFIYEAQKRTAVKARENVRIIKARLKEAEKNGVKREIEDLKLRLAHYTREYTTAQQNEDLARRKFEQGAQYGEIKRK